MTVSEVVCKGAQFEWYREPTWPVSKNETDHFLFPVMRFSKLLYEIHGFAYYAL